MQNDHTVQLDHERLCLEQEDAQVSTTTKTSAEAISAAAEEPFMAMVVLPAKIKSGRHSRPLAPPVEARQGVPGSARRLVPSSSEQPPVVPPRPEHTLTSHSRPISPLPVIPVMELVSLPASAASNSGLNSLLANRKPVSLTSPRPEPEREGNLYTEAPKKLQEVLPQKSQSISVISSQVHHTAASKKIPVSTSNSESTIFCQDCGKCKCEACCRPRKLPEKWLCGGTCLCSQTTIIDTLSCMCCVKGLVYHCTKDQTPEQEDSGRHNLVKWATLATCWPFIPCLLTYPLLSTCANLSQVVYAKCTASGCQCQRSCTASNISSQQPLSLNNKNMIIDSQPPREEIKRLIKPKP